ncbi:MAG TPA: serine/threonine-protein kinase [Euzebyales bacterium]
MATDASSVRRVAGRYRLDRLVGRGGSGAVWRGYDERLDRAVAVKEITFPIDADEAAVGRSRALREARAAARLGGAGVVGIYDIIEGDGTVHLIMELVEAPDLATLVRRAGPLTPPTAARLGLQVLDTLEAAHREGIIHRDIKPSNVLIDGDRPRLADFGIARLGDESTLTATGVVMGTPAYIAPEHARGDEVGPAADLYGLGATLYYAVEGVPPFRSSGSMATVVAALNEAPRAPERAGALADVLTDLLVKDPTDRPDAAALRGRLERVAALGGVLPDEDAAERTTEEIASARAVAAGAAGAAVGPGVDADTDRGAPAADEEGTAAGQRGAASAGVRVSGSEPVDGDLPGSTRDTADDGDPAARRAAAGVARAPDWSRGPGRSARRSRSGRRLLPVALALMLAAVIAAAGWWLVDGNERRDTPAAAGVAATPSERSESAAAPTRGSTGTGGSTDESAGGPSPTPTPSQAAPDPPPDADPPSTPAPQPQTDGVLPALDDVQVPPDWVTFDGGRQPYSVAHPPGWQVIERSATITDLRDPATGTYLRLDWVSERRDPVGAWRTVEAGLRSRQDDYQRLQLTPTTFRGDRAALWEYRYRDGGTELHAYNLGVNRGDFGFALNLQARQDRFDRVARQLWPYFLASYRFQGG